MFVYVSRLMKVRRTGGFVWSYGRHPTEENSAPEQHGRESLSLTLLLYLYFAGRFPPLPTIPFYTLIAARGDFALASFLTRAMQRRFSPFTCPALSPY